jgi:heptosyltransferase-2
MPEVKKILIIRLGAIGDVVHSSIIQKAIKNDYPASKIFFLTLQNTSNLIKYDPNLETVYSFDSKKKNNLLYLLKLGLTLQKERFDVVINLSNTLRTQFLTLLSFPKKIVLRKKRGLAEHAVQKFFASALSVFPSLKLPNNLSLYLDKKILFEIKNKVQDYPRPFWIINPAGENAHLREGRIWSLENWEALGHSLVEQYGSTLFVVGSEKERSYHEQLQCIPNSLVYSGLLSLEESAALFSTADLFISGDSGPLHMASALGVHTLGIMGSTSASACGPYGTLAFAINPLISCNTNCSKVCAFPDVHKLYKPCIESIKPEVVMHYIKTNLWEKIQDSSKIIN